MEVLVLKNDRTMITFDESGATIKCDKCGHTSTKKLNHNERFYREGWSMNPRAKKYIHRCYFCLTRKEKDAHDFVKSKFGVS